MCSLILGISCKIVVQTRFCGEWNLEFGFVIIIIFVFVCVFVIVIVIADVILF